MIKITFDEKELKRLREFRSQLNSISTAIDSMKKEIDSLFNMATAGEKQKEIKPTASPTPQVSMNGYSPNFTWRRKAEYFISKSQTPLTTSEIANLILAAEPTLERKKIIGAVSSILSPHYIGKSKGVVKSENERGEAVFSMERT
jgi:hypothetical protein